MLLVLTLTGIYVGVGLLYLKLAWYFWFRIYKYPIFCPNNGNEGLVEECAGHKIYDRLAERYRSGQIGYVEFQNSRPTSLITGMCNCKSHYHNAACYSRSNSPTPYQLLGWTTVLWPLWAIFWIIVGTAISVGWAAYVIGKHGIMPASRKLFFTGKPHPLEKPYRLAELEADIKHKEAELGIG